MNDSVDLFLLQAPDASVGLIESLEALAGCWKLDAGQALSLQARRAGVLRIAHGRVWATFDHADQSGSTRAGDHFLSRGESLYLQPGERLVMESFGIGHTPSVYFSWEPARASRSAAAVPASAPGVPRRVRVMGTAVTRAATVFAMIFIAITPVITRLNALLLQKL
jgi:hypothetical protein